MGIWPVIEETGRVVREDGAYAWVETQRSSSCGGCAAQKGCGTGALAGWLGARHHEVRALNPIEARPGDQVIIGLREEMLVRGSLAVYLVPLLFMLLGGSLGEIMAPQLGSAGGDGPALAGALSGFVLGFFWLRGYNRRSARREESHPVILRRQESISPVVFSPQS